MLAIGSPGTGHHRCLHSSMRELKIWRMSEFSLGKGAQERESIHLHDDRRRHLVAVGSETVDTLAKRVHDLPVDELQLGVRNETCERRGVSSAQNVAVSGRRT